MNTSHINSQRSSAGNPSIRSPASRAITSDSDEECEIAPCFLQSHVTGQKVFGPIKHRIAPDVDLLSLRSPAKLASQNSISWQSAGLSPTWLVMTWSAVLLI